MVRIGKSNGRVRKHVLPKMFLLREKKNVGDLRPFAQLFPAPL